MGKINSDDYKMSDEELEGYAKNYDSSLAMSLLKRLRKRTRNLPGFLAGSARLIIEPLGHLISALDNPDTPVSYKAIIMGAIGYIILPTDIVPDAIPSVGFLDDLGVTAGVVAMVKAFSTFSLASLDRAIDLEEDEEKEREDGLYEEIVAQVADSRNMTTSEARAFVETRAHEVGNDYGMEGEDVIDILKDYDARLKKALAGEEADRDIDAAGVKRIQEQIIKDIGEAHDMKKRTVGRLLEDFYGDDEDD